MPAAVCTITRSLRRIGRSNARFCKNDRYSPLNGTVSCTVKTTGQRSAMIRIASASSGGTTNHWK